MFNIVDFRRIPILTIQGTGRESNRDGLVRIYGVYRMWQFKKKNLFRVLGSELTGHSGIAKFFVKGKCRYKSLI